MYDFNHEPRRRELTQRYGIHLTSPARCARELLEGTADLGLIPIAALTGSLQVVPGCTIASLARSIQLVVKSPRTPGQIRSIAADTASRSSVAYAQVILDRFYNARPTIRPHAAALESMLAEEDAALIIGDPALLALERRAEVEARVGPCTWHDVAELWSQHTGLPWVAAVWAVRPESLSSAGARAQLIEDLNLSREHGVANIDSLVAEWTPRIAIPPETIRAYLTTNIHYALSPECVRSILAFRQFALESQVLPALPQLQFLS